MVSVLLMLVLYRRRLWLLEVNLCLKILTILISIVAINIDFYFIIIFISCHLFDAIGCLVFRFFLYFYIFRADILLCSLVFSCIEITLFSIQWIIITCSIGRTLEWNNFKLIFIVVSLKFSLFFWIFVDDFW